MINKKTGERIDRLSKEYIDDMKRISDFIFKNPELGGEEHVSCRYLADIAEDMGFDVTDNYCDLETSFMAELNNGEGATLGVIVEYDALPGFGPDGTPAHACGHNWISAVGMGTAMIINSLRDDFKGRLRIIGTPAMENRGCKAEMIKAGAFDDVDVVLQSHLEQYTTIRSRLMALDAMRFEFRGRASHAAASPDQGINALDSVQFMFMGINALRQYLNPDVKINGIVCEGGESPSTIPGSAACEFYIRANSRKYLEEIRPRIIRCAEGAALMAGTEVNTSYFENSCDNILNTPALDKMALEYIEGEGIELSDESEVMGGMSSSDIGNVSHVCPTLYMEFDVEADGRFRVHDESALEYVNSEFAWKKLIQVSRIMAKALMELFNNRELLERVKKEHNSILRNNAVGK